MVAAVRLFQLSALVLGLHSVAARGSQCKNVPGSAGWPSTRQWSKLNKTTGGALLAPKPPAIVCDRTRDEYSPSACATVNNGWFLNAFHEADPVSLQLPNWQQDGCLPSIVYNGTCQLHPYPKYTVNASTPQHVVDAVNFAMQHNLRASIKNTGHDYIGRSTSPEFSIWTHHLNDISYAQSFQAENCASCSGIPAITIQAGNQMEDIYSFADKHNILIAGGSDPGVGLGGWLTSGGHSPLGAKVGLGVDNVIEMEIVEPSGLLVKANECQNSDLFWAFRGGGGSTFGVLVSATMKTYENFPSATFSLLFQTWNGTQNGSQKEYNTNFNNLLADMFAELVPWSDNSINGYFSWGDINALSFLPDLPSPEPKLFSFGGYGHNMSAATLQALMNPFLEKLNSTNGVNGSFQVTEVPKASTILGTNGSTDVGSGYNILLGSRLWDKAALTNRSGLLSVFEAFDKQPLQGLFISGPAVRQQNLISSTSVSPTWRQAYLHILTAASWGYRNATGAQQSKDQLTEVLVPVLANHAPEMGAYMNEANAYEPEAHTTFWGSNYPRLLSLKRQYDPNGTFWCFPCIGNEDWSINQKTGQLCHVN